MDRAVLLNSQSLEGRRLASRIAMIVVLVSFSMLFASLFLGYVYFRITSPVWPPMGMEKVSLFFPTISTFLIVLSSLTFIVFKSSFGGGTDKKKTMFWLGVTILLGLVFMGCQLSLWADLSSEGFYASSGIFPSLIYSLTWIHAAHVVMAIFTLLWLIPNVFKNDFTVGGENKVHNVGSFWHFLSVVWILMYFLIFVI